MYTVRQQSSGEIFTICYRTHEPRDVCLARHPPWLSVAWKEEVHFQMAGGSAQLTPS